ncbi:8967_t:CDS:2, partial [Funneliformis caledonium]
MTTIEEIKDNAKGDYVEVKQRLVKWENKNVKRLKKLKKEIVEDYTSKKDELKEERKKLKKEKEERWVVFKRWDKLLHGEFVKETEKSRLLQEIHSILFKKTQESENGKVRFIFKDAVYLNVTYSNSLAAKELNERISKEASMAIRILYNYFIHRNKNMGYYEFIDLINEKNAKYLSLSHILYITHKDKVNRSEDDQKLAIVIGIDKVNKLNNTSNIAFHSLINSIGSYSCQSERVFFISILVEIIVSLLQLIFTKLMHQALYLPLHLLGDSDILKIAYDIEFDDKYIYNNNLFRRIIINIGDQTKWRNMKSNNPQKIGDKIIKEESKKVKKIAEKIENLQPECVIVNKDNLAKFYRNVYSSHAQFAAKLKVLDSVGEIIANEISNEQKKRKFDDVNDLCKHIKKFSKLSLNCI